MNPPSLSGSRHQHVFRQHRLALMLPLLGVAMLLGVLGFALVFSLETAQHLQLLWLPGTITSMFVIIALAVYRVVEWCVFAISVGFNRIEVRVLRGLQLIHRTYYLDGCVVTCEREVPFIFFDIGTLHVTTHNGTETYRLIARISALRALLAERHERFYHPAHPAMAPRVDQRSAPARYAVTGERRADDGQTPSRERTVGTPL